MAPTKKQDDPEIHDVIRCRRFELVDDEGRVRATINTDVTHSEGLAPSVGLELKAASGFPSIKLDVDAEAACVWIRDNNSNARASISVRAGGTASLSLLDRDAVRGLEVSIGSDGSITWDAHSTRARGRAIEERALELVIDTLDAVGVDVSGRALAVQLLTRTAALAEVKALREAIADFLVAAATDPARERGRSLWLLTIAKVIRSGELGEQSDSPAAWLRIPTESTVEPAEPDHHERAGQ